MAVSIKSTQTFEWAGGYPLNFSQGAVAAAGNFALVYFTTGPSYDPAAVLPVVTWGSKTATLVHGFTNTGAAGTIWVYRIANPTAGTLSVSLANTYIGPGMVSVLCLDGVDTANPIGGSDTDGVAATGNSASISLTTQEPNGLIIQFAMGIYDGTPSLTWGSPTASLVFSSDNPANRILRVYKQEPSSAGQVISATWDNTYNQNVISALEVRPWTLVEDKGDTLLVLIGGSYHVVPSGGQPIKITRYNAGIGPTSYAGWAVIQAEKIPGGSGYKLLWFNASSGAYNEWTVTSAGVYSSQAAPTDIKVQEVFYGVDLNGDGQIGVPQFLIEDNGDAELWLIGDDYHVTDANGTKIKLKRYGSGFGPNFVPGWTVTQAEPKPGGGYYIFWAKNDLTDFGVWTHDAAGVFLSTQVVTNVTPWEDIFKADLNGDGVGGPPPAQTISTSAIASGLQLGVLVVAQAQAASPQMITVGVLAANPSLGNLYVGDAPQAGESLTKLNEGALYTVSRSGGGTYFDAARDLQAVAANAARHDHYDGYPLGIMVEEASTNLIGDSTATDAVVSGAYPAGAGFYNGGAAGLTCVVAGKGIEDGIEYVDLKFSGTNGSGAVAYASYNMGAMTDAPVTNGDTVTLSAYVRISAGNAKNPANNDYPYVSLGMNAHDSTQGYSSTLANVQPILNTDVLEREWTTATVSDANAAYVNALLALSIPDGATIDFTVRLGLPQLEKKSYPTSPIKTVSGAIATRGAETMNAILTGSASETIYVERVGRTWLRKIDSYTAQDLTSGSWGVPSDTDYPYIRRIATTPLAAQSKTVTTAGAKGYKFGAAFKLSEYNSDAAYKALIQQEAAIYCPEYEFKPDQVQPTTEGTFDFTVADSFAALATTDGALLRGHALLWHAATPAWMQTALSGASQARWQELIDDHFAQVANRWSVTSWDVVNEVLEPLDGISGGFRNSAWYQAAGSDYIAYAFQRAKAYNTTAKLYLAEYGCEENDKQAIDRRTALLALLTSLVNAGVPIDGVALQAHVDIERPFSKSAFVTFLNAIKALGLEIILSEFDVRAPAEDATLQYDLRAARRVRQVIDAYLSVGAGNKVLFWNLNDQYSWLHSLFPGRTQRPLPFNDNNRPKAMYAALQQSFELAEVFGETGLSGILIPGLSAGIAAGVPTVGAGAISVSPSGLSAGITAGVPTVGAGAISVSPSGLSAGITAGVPTVGAGGISVSPSGLSAGITAGVPAVDAGAISVSPSGLSAGITAGVPTVGAGGISVSPSGLSVSITAGVPAVGAGGISVSPSGLSVSITTGAPAIGVGGNSVSPSGLSASIAAGVPAIGVGAVSVSPSGHLVNFAAGQPTLEAGITGIVSNDLASTIICGEPNVSISVSEQGGFYAIETGNAKISLNVTQLGELSKILLGQPDISVGGVAILPGSVASPILLGSTYVGRVISVLGLYLSSTLGVPVVTPGAVTLQPGQLVVPSVFGGIVVRGGEYSGPLFTFNDGEWQPYEMKVFKNGAWVHARIKRRVGDEWVDV